MNAITALADPQFVIGLLSGCVLTLLIVLVGRIVHERRERRRDEMLDQIRTLIDSEANAWSKS